jgi:hypothetical protein
VSGTEFKDGKVGPVVWYSQSRLFVDQDFETVTLRMLRHDPYGSAISNANMMLARHGYQINNHAV